MRPPDSWKGPYWDPRDIWVGVYWTRENSRFVPTRGGVLEMWLSVYICVLPCFPVRMRWYARPKERS